MPTARLSRSPWPRIVGRARGTAASRVGPAEAGLEARWRGATTNQVLLTCGAASGERQHQRQTKGYQLHFSVAWQDGESRATSGSHLMQRLMPRTIMGSTLSCAPAFARPGHLLCRYRGLLNWCGLPRCNAVYIPPAATPSTLYTICSTHRPPRPLPLVTKCCCEGHGSKIAAAGPWLLPVSNLPALAGAGLRRCVAVGIRLSAAGPEAAGGSAATANPAAPLVQGRPGGG